MTSDILDDESLERFRDFAARGVFAQMAVDEALAAHGPKILAIDPGTRESAYVGMLGSHVMLHGKCTNDNLQKRLDGNAPSCLLSYFDHVVIEMISNYGNAVGADVFETVFWIGRFYQTAAFAGAKVARILRHEVKMRMCGNPRAKDNNIRQAIIDRYGPGKEIAIGRKAKPGPLYGMTVDRWQALAVGLTWLDRQGGAP